MGRSYQLRGTKRSCQTATEIRISRECMRQVRYTFDHSKSECVDKIRKALLHAMGPLHAAYDRTVRPLQSKSRKPSSHATALMGKRHRWRTIWSSACRLEFIGTARWHCCSCITSHHWDSATLPKTVGQQRIRQSDPPIPTAIYRLTLETLDL